MSQLPTPEYSASPRHQQTASHTPYPSPGDKARRGKWTLDEEAELLDVATRLYNEREANWEQIRAAMKGKGKRRSAAALKARYKTLKEKEGWKEGRKKGKGVSEEDLEVESESEYDNQDTGQYSQYSPASWSADSLEHSAGSPTATPVKPVVARPSLPDAVAALPSSPFARSSPPWSIAEDAALLSTICIPPQPVSWVTIQQAAARTYAFAEGRQFEKKKEQCKERWETVLTDTVAFGHNALPWVSEIEHISKTLARGVAAIMEIPSRPTPLNTVASSTAEVLQQSSFQGELSATLASRASQAQPFASSSATTQDFALCHPLPTRNPSNSLYGGLQTGREHQQALQPRRSFSGQAVPPFANCPSPISSSSGLPPPTTTQFYMEVAQGVLDDIAKTLSDKPTDSTPPSAQSTAAPRVQSSPPSRQDIEYGGLGSHSHSSRQRPLLPPPVQPTLVPVASSSAPLPPATLAQLANQAVRWKSTVGGYSPLCSQSHSQSQEPATSEPQSEVEKVNDPVDAPAQVAPVRALEDSTKSLSGAVKSLLEVLQEGEEAGEGKDPGELPRWHIPSPPKMQPRVEASQAEHAIKTIDYAHPLTAATQALDMPSSSAPARDAGSAVEQLPLLAPSSWQAQPFEGMLRSPSLKRIFPELEQEARVQAEEDGLASRAEVKRRKA